jgi:(1->4)-alpha-D-glucan 1-alpha-D-glucosylmutase
MATPAPAPHQRARAATYRVQLNAGFTFDDAAAIADYLAALGASHLYCSPILQATAGSTHGYDVVDHRHLNSELGGRPGYRKLAGRLAEAGLGEVIDVVPNHMALAGRANAWWWDVLENGPSSVYASHFDIDWDPPQRKLADTVLMPVLGDQYGRVLEAGELVLERQDGSFTVRYHDQQAPISPRTLGGLLTKAAARARSEELESLAVAFGRLPHAHRTDRAAVTERHRDKEVLRARLADRCRARPAVAKAIDAEVEAVNSDPDALDDLLGQQNFRLAYWRTGAEELSYRRFFDIETLAGLRVEDEAVFADTHGLILGLVADGSVDGLRVDHVDGLADPEGYLARLRDATGGAYVVVEKILEAGEQLPESWPVAGTTGYEFLNQAGQLFVDVGNEAAMRGAYTSFTGLHQDYADIVYEAKLQIMREDLAAEVERLTALLADVCERHRRQRDHTRRELRDALREIIAAMGVYRTYFRPGRAADTTGTAADTEHLAAAVAAATRRRPDLDAELLRFIRDLITGDYAGAGESAFAVRFAQVSAPVMAKGVEDTAFYRYQPLVSLNEVGGDPARFGASAAGFHRAMATAAERWPQTMLTLSTHDTKRSGDVRARINVLSELPGPWEQAVLRWSERNRRHKQNECPDRGAEYLLYQSLVGAWPVGAGRAAAFMHKAAKEAKVHTSWTDPDTGYDDALSAFVTAVLADEGFVADLESFLAEHAIVARGRVSSLAQTTLMLTCPGVPDLYQGTEVWDLSLVDPDNRRPVDYAARRALLQSLSGATPEAALARDDDGGPKLWLIHRVLTHRRSNPGPYGPASGYEPLEVTGPRSSHAVAFTRTGGLVTVVPRLTRPGEAWEHTTVALPAGEWVSVLTGDRAGGGEVGVAELLQRFPVAVLAREG